MHCWWRDSDIAKMGDDELVELVCVLEQAVRQRSDVLEDPQLLSAMGMRLARALAEIEMRGQQLRLDYGSASS